MLISWKYTYFIWIRVQLLFFYEVIVLEDGSYFIVSNERHRTDLSDVILQTVRNKHQLYVLVNSLEKLNICSGVFAEKYKNLLPENNASLAFKTIDGESGAFVETVPRN